ncbi:MAG: DUF6468 domain-containing protein [Dongiaceae bacterium]
MSISLISDGVLILLLAVTLVAVYRFNRKLTELRQGREAFEKLIAEFRQATGQADHSLQQLRHLAETRGRDLQDRAEAAGGTLTDMQRANSDLRLLIERAELASDRLEDAVARSRDISQSFAAQRAPDMSDGALKREPLMPQSAAPAAKAEAASINLSLTRTAAEVSGDKENAAKTRKSVLSSLVGIR